MTSPCHTFLAKKGKGCVSEVGICSHRSLAVTWLSMSHVQVKTSVAPWAAGDKLAQDKEGRHAATMYRVLKLYFTQLSISGQSQFVPDLYGPTCPEWDLMHGREHVPNILLNKTYQRQIQDDVAEPDERSTPGRVPTERQYGPKHAQTKPQEHLVRSTCLVKAEANPL